VLDGSRKRIVGLKFPNDIIAILIEGTRERKYREEMNKPRRRAEDVDVEVEGVGQTNFLSASSPASPSEGRKTSLHHLPPSQSVSKSVPDQRRRKTVLSEAVEEKKEEDEDDCVFLEGTASPSDDSSNEMVESLRDKNICKNFKAYLESNYCDENLLFHLEVALSLFPRNCDAQLILHYRWKS